MDNLILSATIALFVFGVYSGWKQNFRLWMGGMAIYVVIAIIWWLQHNSTH